MFVLLEHDAAGPAIPGSSAVCARHCDLLVEFPDQERLPTWRLADNPLTEAAPISAERIGDHRRLYLEFEGQISGGRGVVRRLDRGAAHVTGCVGDELAVDLCGEHLRGSYEIVRAPANRLVFRKVT